jgi:hypothetical protein
VSKGERRGNRETKKPKQVKPKELAPLSPFATKAGTLPKQLAKKK